MEVKSPWEARALHLPSYVAKRRYTRRASSSHIDQEEHKVPAELRNFSLYASDGTLTVFTVTTYQYAYNTIGQYLFCFHFDNSEAVKWSSFLQM